MYAPRARVGGSTSSSRRCSSQPMNAKASPARPAEVSQRRDEGGEGRHPLPPPPKPERCGEVGEHVDANRRALAVSPHQQPPERIPQARQEVQAPRVTAVLQGCVEQRLEAPAGLRPRVHARPDAPRRGDRAGTRSRSTPVRLYPEPTPKAARAARSRRRDRLQDPPHEAPRDLGAAHLVDGSEEDPVRECRLEHRVKILREDLRASRQPRRRPAPPAAACSCRAGSSRACTSRAVSTPSSSMPRSTGFRVAAHRSSA